MTTWVTYLLQAQVVVTGAMLAGCALNALTAPRAEWLKAPGAMSALRRKRLRLLIPARNEAENLGALLPRLRALEWDGKQNGVDSLEIILLDDQSEDATLAMAQAFAAENPHFKVITGAPLPPHWLGKNWACHQLAQAALAGGSDILIFCDADAQPEPSAIWRTVVLLERHGTGMASFIPRQILGSPAEQAVIPVLLHLACLSALPLRFIPWLKWRALGVANGQWLAFTREGYARIGGHASVRDHVVEDLGLARRAQATGAGLVLALASRTLTVRMYRNFNQVWNGFGKNLFILAGSWWQGLPLLVLFLLGNLAPWFSAAYAILPGAADAVWSSDRILYVTPLVLLLFARLFTIVLLREPLTSLFWHPFGALLVPIIAMRSAWGRKHGTLTWKGRNLQTDTPSPLESYP
jgi:chlorobactene glucosyltransferase